MNQLKCFKYTKNVRYIKYLIRFSKTPENLPNNAWYWENGHWKAGGVSSNGDKTEWVEKDFKDWYKSGLPIDGPWKEISIKELWKEIYKEDI